MGIREEFEKAFEEEGKKPSMKYAGPFDAALFGASWMAERCASYCADSAWQLPSIKASGEIMASVIRRMGKDLDS